MSNKTGKKVKRSLQTTLGKAVHDNDNANVDLSHVQKPINTSLFGLRQVLSLFQTATKEVQNYITHECDIIYECRICKTIFRSLANFILHKREYCRERYNHIDFINNNDDFQEDTNLENAESDFDDQAAQFSPNKNETSNTGTKKRLLPVIERLKERQEVSQLAQDVLTQDLSSKEGVEDSSNANTTNRDHDLLLEEITTNNAAVFQTVVRKSPTGSAKKLDFMRTEVMEIHGILDSDEAVLGPDGKICTFETNKVNEKPIIPKNEWICPECKFKFSTKKTLTYHIKYKHNNTRLIYICPDCKDSFANVWCVYRHLYKVHRRTSAQIRRLRDQIHSSCVRRDQEPIKKQDKQLNERVDNADEENQWLSNIEGDNDIQMCGGCGKRFERKAALNSHAQMCTKRIAVCNNIKENNAKKKDEGSPKDQKHKSTKTDKVVLKGSSKRKPYLLRTYKYNEDDNCDSRKVTPSNDSDIQDVNANCEIMETTCDNNKEMAEEEIHNMTNSLSSSEDRLSHDNNKEIADNEIHKAANSLSSLEDVFSSCDSNKETADKEIHKTTNSLPSSEDLLFPRDDNEIAEELHKATNSLTSSDLVSRDNNNDIVEEEIHKATNSLSSSDLVSHDMSNEIAEEEIHKARNYPFSSEDLVSPSHNKDIGEEELHKPTNSQSSSEDLLSPSKQDFGSSLSIEQIDTEKMLHIIGIITDFGKSTNGSTSDSNCPVDSNTKQHESKEGRSHTASDFDLFCQSVSENLLTETDKSTTGEIEEPPQKIEKTVPLILRRRKKLSKSERKNSILERSKRSTRSDVLNEKAKDVKDTSMAETNNLEELAGLSPQTNSKINVKKLADLIGVSPQDHKKNSGMEAIIEVPTNPELNDIASDSNELSENLIVDVVSINRLCDNDHPNCLKRQRTSSFDITEFHRYSKQSKGDSPSKHDSSFVSRASPFMDQTKILCIPCDTTFPTMAKLLWHMSAHFSWFRFQCSRCSFISFNNLDCVNHARKVHGIKNTCLQSVVLPIPNWKTVLMAHDFDFVNEENVLGGKHTDEILSGDLDEATSDDLDQKKENDEYDTSEPMDILFEESQSLDIKEENDLLETDFTPNQLPNNILQENIDIVNNDEELFQVDVPQEIYSPHVSELIGGIKFEEREPYCTRLSIKDLIGEDDDFKHFNFFNETEIKTEEMSNEINENLQIESNEDVNNAEDQECLASRLRPTRNRTKSIKTIQNDFFYDLNKVIKLNDSSVSKSNTQKHKKSASQKNSSGGKSSTHSLKVYSKRN